LSILDSELAEQLADALISADLPTDVVLTRTEQDPESPPWAPVDIDIDHPCKGWRDTYSAADRIAGDVLTSDVRVFVIASTIDTVPTTSDRVSVNGSALGSVVRVSVDPATAAWELQVRV
jgi:hypothetical protein